MRPSWIALATVAGSLLWTTDAAAVCSNDTDCSGGPARIMLIVDASSDMLNDGNSAGSMGQTPWDVLREVVAGSGDTLYDAPVEPSGPVASQVVHFGLTVFGNGAPDTESRILVAYAPCSEPRVDWALDPLSSCLEPGCSDPWGGPPIMWTSQDGSLVDPPDFSERTVSHMPQCNGNANRCEGSGRVVEPAIDLVTDALGVYTVTTPYLRDDTTTYVNVLVVSGEYVDADADVQTALEQAVAEGLTTYVVAFADAAPGGAWETQLTSMADWGSGGTLTHRVATNSGELAGVLDEIIDDLALPCCATIDCAHVGGADSGGADGTGGDAGADWGGQDGTAGDVTGASMSAGSGGTGTGTETAGELDDDGGCTCRSTAPPRASWLALLLLGLRRRGRYRK